MHKGRLSNCGRVRSSRHYWLLQNLPEHTRTPLSAHPAQFWVEINNLATCRRAAGLLPVYLSLERQAGLQNIKNPTKKGVTFRKLLEHNVLVGFVRP